MSVRDRFHDPVTWRRFHGYATLVWLGLIVPSLAWWRTAIPWLVFMSVWANLATHFSAWQGARAEVQSAANPPEPVRCSPPATTAIGSSTKSTLPRRA